MTRLAMLFIVALPCAALAAGSFTLESAEVKPNSIIAEAQVFKGFGCEGGNVSPSLTWKNAPAGTKSDFGKPGYGGPCPPKGDKPHRYIFTVYALKVDKIDADENASAAMVGFMINANKIDKASFTATYGIK